MKVLILEDGMRLYFKLVHEDDGHKDCDRVNSGIINE